MGKIIMTLFVAAVGGLVGIKLKIPAGALVFSMLAVAIYNIYTANAFIPYNFRVMAQIVVGGMIGLRFTKETMVEIKEILIPSIVIILVLTVFSLFLAFVLHKTTGMDIVTALFSTAPGGLTDMSLISDSYGADSPKVAVIHTLRIVLVVTFVPIIIKFITRFM
ncbi:MAG: AbrB family transcriptional regulator [Gudongella sp.]|nr:AbrB family transcriptional regulator [Gudongella sp.]